MATDPSPYNQYIWNWNNPILDSSLGKKRHKTPKPERKPCRMNGTMGNPSWDRHRCTSLFATNLIIAMPQLLESFGDWYLIFQNGTIGKLIQVMKLYDTLKPHITENKFVHSSCCPFPFGMMVEGQQQGPCETKSKCWGKCTDVSTCCTTTSRHHNRDFNIKCEQCGIFFNLIPPEIALALQFTFHDCEQ